MTEDQIRSDIRAYLPRFLRNASEAYLVEEMEVCAGRARVDMAVVSNQLIGIEIKGSQDNLRRLPSQVEQYSKCFDRVVLVVHEIHVRSAVEIIPEWWGVIIGRVINGQNYYHMKRRPAKNNGVDIDAVLALLWRQELDSLVSKFTVTKLPVRAPKKKLRENLLSSVCPSKLSAASIHLLRQRQDWRSVQII